VFAPPTAADHRAYPTRQAGVVEQLPRIGRRIFIELQQHDRRARQERFQLDRHQKLEQAAADLLVAVFIVGPDPNQLVDELGLRGPAVHLAARAPGVQGEFDHRAACIVTALHGDEVVAGAAITGLQRPRQRTTPGNDLRQKVEALRIGRRQGLQRVVRLGRAVEIKLDQLQVCHHRPVGRSQPFIRLAHALRDGLRRRADVHTGTAGADQRRCQLEVGRPAGVALAHALGIGERGPAAPSG